MSNQGFFVWCSNRALEHNQQLPSEIPPENQYEVHFGSRGPLGSAFPVSHPGEDYPWSSCAGLKLSSDSYDQKKTNPASSSIRGLA